jgi:hypothetical protein
LATIHEIRAMRSRLENEVGRLLRAFEDEAGMQVGRITFGPVYAQAIGELPRAQPIMAREDFDCIIELVL